MSYQPIEHKKYKRYLDLAKHISTWSKDSTKIGAVCIGEFGRVLSTGYNGMPRGYHDNYDIPREEKLLVSVHAEMNCIYNATLNGVSLKDSTLFLYGLPPCNECAKGIIQAGIKSVIYKLPDIQSKSSDEWNQIFKTSAAMFTYCGVYFSCE